MESTLEERIEELEKRVTQLEGFISFSGLSPQAEGHPTITIDDSLAKLYPEMRENTPKENTLLQRLLELTYEENLALMILLERDHLKTKPFQDQHRELLESITRKLGFSELAERMEQGMI